MSKNRLILICLLLLWLTQCGFPSSGEVKKQFIEENPQYIVLSAAAGEGDSSAVYYHIVYKNPVDGKEHEDVWQYMKDKDGKWIVFHKEHIK